MHYLTLIVLHVLQIHPVVGGTLANSPPFVLLVLQVGQGQYSVDSIHSFSQRRYFLKYLICMHASHVHSG